MAKNEILPFGAAAGANVLTPKDYETLSSRLMGFSAGIAESKQLNTVWRQSSIIANLMAQFIADKSGKDVLDNGDMVTLRANLEAALKAFITANIDKNEFLLKANNLSDIVDKAVGRANLELAGIKITGSTAGSNAGVGTPVASGKASAAIGERSSASAENATAVGCGANASATNATAIGPSALASLTNSTAIGYGSTTTRANEVSFGAADKKRVLANVAPGTQDSDVVILGQLAQLMTKICPHSVGDVIFRATATSPQTDYPGTTWVKLPADVMIRTANMAASNILQTGGRDSVTLSINEMPAHSHDLQAYPSNTALDGGSSNRRSVDAGNSQLDSQVIKSAGGGQAFSILNSHISVVGWRRTA
ncbi:TPA: hypothetical protein KNH08_005382 [Serratia fonticola]|nr:hypothetical protein [Serratia fonticola]